jgi:hypothetical protein
VILLYCTYGTVANIHVVDQQQEQIEPPYTAITARIFFLFANGGTCCRLPWPVAVMPLLPLQKYVAQ